MNIKVKILLTVFITLLSALLISDLSLAGEYHSEVMTLTGQAQVIYAGETAPQELKQGDLLKEGDKLVVGENSFVDLAFDKEWNNVTRLAQKTEIEIRSIYPTGIAMTKGDVFARLDKLPRNSTFEIQTPTCVAAVRGSAYRTIHEDGESRILNYSSSPVEVFGLDDKGNLLDNPVILRGEEKTEVLSVGETPRVPEKMTKEEVQEADNFRDEVKKEIRQAVDEGRASEIQDIKTVDREYQVELDNKIDALAVPEKAVNSESGLDDRAQRIAETIIEIEDRISERVEKELGGIVDKDRDRKDDKKSKGDGKGGRDNGTRSNRV